MASLNLEHLKCQKSSKAQAAPGTVTGLGKSSPAFMMTANRKSGSAVAQINKADKHDIARNRDKIFGDGNDHNTTQKLLTEGYGLSNSPKHMSSQEWGSNIPAVLLSISSVRTKIADLAPGHGDLTDPIATAQQRGILPPLLYGATLLQSHRADFLEPLVCTIHREGAQPLEHHLKGIAKPHSSTPAERIDNVDWPRTSNNDGNAAVKRRKTDVDELRAQLAEERKLVEESKRNLDELRRNTDERQVSLVSTNSAIYIHQLTNSKA